VKIPSITEQVRKGGLPPLNIDLNDRGTAGGKQPFLTCSNLEVIDDSSKGPFFMQTKPNDALAILKLYEIRSEALMRQARAWFFSEFHPNSGLEILALLQSGEKPSAFYRMVSSHWEVAAALVNNGGIDEKMFLEANSEHLVVFAKLQPFLAEIRETIGEPDYLAQLERLVMKAENVEKKLENRRRLIERWAQAKSA